MHILAVETECGVEDFIDLAARDARRADRALPFYRRERFLGAVITGAILYMRVPAPFWALAGAAAGAYLYPRYRSFRSKRDTVQFYRNWAGESQRITLRVELRPAGLWVAQHGLEMLYPWRDVVSITAGGGDLEFALQYGLVMVRSRAFSDDRHRSEFAAAAVQLRSQAAANDS